MSSREEIIRGLYKNYKFLEEDFSKFREMPCLSSVENSRDGVKKLSYCVRQEVIEHGLIDTIKKIENAVEFDIAFSVLHAMSVLTGYVFQGKEIKALANSEEYKGTFDAFIKQECITDIDSLNKREDIISEVFKSVLAIRLQSDEIKKYMQEQEQLEIERIISKRYIYQNMPYSEEKIDEVIKTLSDEEKELINRKERGEKFSYNESHKLLHIKIKIREILEKGTNKKVPQPRKNEEVQKRILQQRPPVNKNVSTIKEQKTISFNAIEGTPKEKRHNQQSKTQREKIREKVCELLQKDELTAELIMEGLPEDVLNLLGKEVEGEKLSNEEYKRVSNVIQTTMNACVTEVMNEAKKCGNEINKNIEESDTLNENRYNIIAYKNIDAPHSLIDKEIAGLPERERQLIQRKGRISVGVFAKLLTQVEEEELKSILNKIRSNLGLEIIPQEKSKIISKTVVRRHKDTASLARMSPEEWAAVLEKLSDNDKRIIKEKEEGKVLNPVDKNRYAYLVNSLKKGIIPKERLKKTSIYEDTPYPKEELDKLIEKLSDNDKRIIKEKEEGNKLNSIDNHRYNYLKKCLKKGIIPVRGRKKDSTTPTKEDKKVKEKNTRIGNRKSIYQMPFSKELIDAAIDKLSPEQQELINRKERGDKLTKNEIWRANNLARSIKIKLEKEEKTPISNKQLQKELSLYEEPINDDQISKEEEKKEETPKPKKRGGQRKELHEFFPGWSEEKIERSMEQLSDGDKAIVEARIKNQEMSAEDEKHLYYIISMLKQGKIPGKKKRDVIKATSYDEDEIKARAHEAYKVISTDKNQSSEKNKKEKLPISNAQLQEELSVPIEKPSMITIGINQVLSSGKESKEYPVPQTIPIQTSKEGNDKLSTDYKRTLAEASNNPIVIEEIDMTDIYMTGIRYGFLNGYPKKSIDEIAEWFGKTPDEVERITDEVLEKLYYVIVNNFKNTEQSDEKIFVKKDGETREE